MTAFRTARLSVVPITSSAEAAPLLPAVFTPEVTAYLPDVLASDWFPDAQTWFLAVQERSPRVALVSDATGPVGMFMQRFPDEADVMVGYLFAAEAWGKGYATEVMQGWVAQRRQAAWHGEVRAGLDPDNIASARVLEKAGFVRLAPDRYALIL